MTLFNDNDINNDNNLASYISNDSVSPVDVAIEAIVIVVDDSNNVDSVVDDDDDDVIDVDCVVSVVVIHVVSVDNFLRF